MSESVLIEIWGEPAGYLEQEGEAFRFHALTRPFFTLDGARFTKPGHARLAAARLCPAASVGHPVRYPPPALPFGMVRFEPAIP